jgi:uncharacterized membrane protein YoaK (UPF0700 family)
MIMVVVHLVVIGATLEAVAMERLPEAEGLALRFMTGHLWQGQQGLVERLLFKTQ